jgi:RimJ/RimL family protein N-acetyltransferase
MAIEVIKTDLKEIQALRILFLQESNFQFIYDKCHTYGWADTYVFLQDKVKIGYGATWGKDKRDERDAIFEFYLLKGYRTLATSYFSLFQQMSGAPFIECQSNDALLTSLLFEHSQNIFAEAILFKDHFQTGFTLPGVIFHRLSSQENAGSEAVEYALKQHEEILATGGLMLNYNMPFADIYYEVNKDYRRRGFGSYMVQELKRAASLIGRVPAARCNITNMASKATLLKAGFSVCGYRLNGTIKKQ